MHRFTSSDKRPRRSRPAPSISLVAAQRRHLRRRRPGTAKFIASISRESTRGFSHQLLRQDGSPIGSVADLKGKTVGLNGFSGAAISG